MKIPNLFIAGLPRSGTSSLHSYLNQHPDIFMTSIKEPNYFAKDFQKESDSYHKKRLYFPYRTKDKYLGLYKKWKDEVIAGEASWTNLYSKLSAKRIHNFSPNAKIIITLREPVDFLYSYHSEATFALGEHISDFETALAAEDDRKKGKRLGKRVIVPSWLFYSEFIKYSDQVKRYFSVFDKSQIRVVIFDALTKKTAQNYINILEFLNVNQSFSPDFNTVNPNKVLKWPRLKRFVLDSPYFRKLLRFISSDDIYATMKNFYKNKIVTYEARPPLNPELRYELMTKFKMEVDKIGHLLNRDMIKLWGYDNI